MESSKYSMLYCQFMSCILTSKTSSRTLQYLFIYSSSIYSLWFMLYNLNIKCTLQSSIWVKYKIRLEKIYSTSYHPQLWTFFYYKNQRFGMMRKWEETCNIMKEYYDGNTCSLIYTVISSMPNAKLNTSEKSKPSC